MNNLTTNQIDYFLSRSSFSGLRMLYSCYCAYKTKKAFTLKDLDKAITSLGIDYSYGWLIASISIGLVKSEINDGIINITEIDPILLNKLEVFIKNYAKNNDLNQDADWLLKFSRVKYVKEVEDYFGYTPDRFKFTKKDPVNNN